MATIRHERLEDTAQIHAVHCQAFGQQAEAQAVDVLREACPEGISLVAEEGDRIVGHVLFTPAIIEDGETRVIGSSLAPLAVLPENQRTGIGSALVRAGLEELRAAGEPFVVVIGHPAYYPKFGFEQAAKRGLGCEYSEVPDEAFMIVVFDDEKINGVRGIVKIRPEFAAAM